MHKDDLMHQKSHAEFRSLLRALCQKGVERFSGKAGLYITSGNVISGINELDRLTKEPKGDLGSTVVPLESPNASKFQDWLIGLWAQWNFVSDKPKVKIEVCFLESRQKGFYFRFESPHGNSRHNYHHAQFCKNFSPPLVGPNSNWDVHASTPAFPLACADEGGMLIASAISIYGAQLDPDVQTTIMKMSLQDSFLRSILAKNLVTP